MRANRFKSCLWSMAVVLCSAAASPAFAADNATPIKLAFLAIDAGPFAPSTEININAIKFAVETVNAQGGIAGRSIDLVIENDDGTPASAIVHCSRPRAQGDDARRRRD